MALHQARYKPHVCIQSALQITSQLHHRALPLSLACCGVCIKRMLRLWVRVHGPARRQGSKGRWGGGSIPLCCSSTCAHIEGTIGVRIMVCGPASRQDVLLRPRSSHAWRCGKGQVLGEQQAELRKRRPFRRRGGHASQQHSPDLVRAAIRHLEPPPSAHMRVDVVVIRDLTVWHGPIRKDLPAVHA